jgi:hypothetical protein
VKALKRYRCLCKKNWSLWLSYLRLFVTNKPANCLCLVPLMSETVRKKQNAAV